MNVTVQVLTERLAKAQEKLAYLESRQARLDGRATAATPGQLADGTWDSAVLSGISRKPNPKKTAARFRTYDLAASGQKDVDDARWLVTSLERQLAAAEAEATRVQLTRDDIKGATHVRTERGWHRIARLNPTTVSVETGYSWTDRHPYSKILEARTVTEAVAS